MVGDVAHMVIQRPTPFAQHFIRHLRERLVKVLLESLGRGRAMSTPHHHRYQTYLAVRNPAQIILVVARGYDRGFAEIAVSRHCTFKVTVECHFTDVPATGTDDTALVHFVVFALGPRVT